MSEQMTDTEPKPSTACNLRIMAFSRDIFCVPNESTIVTIELSASGIAATARAMANISESITESKLITSARHIESPNTNAQIISMPMESFLPKLSSVICRGVLRSPAFCISEAILPTSVSMPTAVTMKEPLP
ncbi:unknown [Ruminococcus sp. CAG:579]|nr:unknown [Ruminococcus sp. CAG:579]